MSEVRRRYGAPRYARGDKGKCTEAPTSARVAPFTGVTPPAAGPMQHKNAYKEIYIRTLTVPW
jgi:hypothetical protein